MLEQMARFWSLQDAAVRAALCGVLLLSLGCGALSPFIVLRRLSLMGDSLGHAVLPGVCVGFMIAREKNPVWIFAGALTSALLAGACIGLIERRTRLKPDAAMGLVLSGFFGLGTVLMTRLQRLPYGNQSGLNQFLFGQASAFHTRDLWLIAGMTGAILICLGLLFKEWTLTSFDPEFAQSLGWPVRGLHYLLLGMAAVAIVISIQAVGIVLLSALLITPAATAYLLTDRLPVMMVLSIGFAILGGVLGLNLSFLGRSLPTGPFIVVALAILFGAAYLFSPRYGQVTRLWRQRRRRLRTEAENTLKALCAAAAAGGPLDPGELATRLELSAARTRRALRRLQHNGFVDMRQGQVGLTPAGERRALELQRNYRLWEDFLTHEVHLPPDHTHRDAEDLEHILTPNLVEQLEAQRSSGDSTVSPESSKHPPDSPANKG